MANLRTRIGLGLAMVAAAFMPVSVYAATINSITNSPMGSGTLSSICNLTPTAGALGFAGDGLAISTDTGALGGSPSGSPAPASLVIASNLLTGAATVTMSAPTLTGDTAAVSNVNINGGSYGTTAVYTIDNTGQATVPVNVRFSKATPFVAGNYSSTATITCTD